MGRLRLSLSFVLGLLACRGADRPPLAMPREPEPPIVVKACVSTSADKTEQAPSWESEQESLRKKTPSKKGDLCEPAESNLTRAKAEVLRAHAAQQAEALTIAPEKAANHGAAFGNSQKPLLYFERVQNRLALTTAEKALLEKNGFVVTSRLTQRSYAFTLHEIYQSELPIYISADAILHAVFIENDRLLAELERTLLLPKLQHFLDALHCALLHIVPLVQLEVARDLDLYLTVARSLLAAAPISSLIGNDEEAARLRDLLLTAEGAPVIKLFGRERRIDASQYKPRGHYADDATLSRYFRSAMWLSRLEFNLLSRSSRSSEPGLSPNPAETPREVNDALALSLLVEQAKMTTELAALEHAWELFAGRREDIDLATLSALRQQAKLLQLDDAAPPQLWRMIGTKYRRTARLHFMPEGSTELPAITTLLGPRIAADLGTLRPLSHSEIAGRHMVSALDVAYVLGHDRAKAHLGDELVEFPTLGAQLDVARRNLRAAPRAQSLYDSYLFAIEALAETPQGQRPSYAATAAYQDLRINSALVAYGQLRHNSVLLVGQEYSEGGCQIPDGYVEPLPAVYRALQAYANRGALVLAELDPHDMLQGQKYFSSLREILGVLIAISEDELSGRPLSEAQKQFLSMVVEMKPATTGSAPTYTGWYFDLFRGKNVEQGALANASFIADYFTSGQTERVAYLGASAPRTAVFVIDTGGPPRVVAGPVAQGYAIQSPLAARLSDETAESAPGKTAVWSSSYSTSDLSAPALGLRGNISVAPGKPIVIKVRSKNALPQVTVELLDHNRRLLAARTHPLPAGSVVPFTFLAGKKAAAALRVRCGEWSHITFPNPNEESLALAFADGEAP